MSFELREGQGRKLTKESYLQRGAESICRSLQAIDRKRRRMLAPCRMGQYSSMSRNSSMAQEPVSKRYALAMESLMTLGPWMDVGGPFMENGPSHCPLQLQASSCPATALTDALRNTERYHSLTPVVMDKHCRATVYSSSSVEGDRSRTYLMLAGRGRAACFARR